MKINDTEIVDTFAEAFTMRFTRIVVTAADSWWLDAGLAEFCGYGTSVIGCDAEVGVEQRLSKDQTPDGRVGAAVLGFAFNIESLGKAITNRCGQCLMTCPSVAVYDGLHADDNKVGEIELGSHLRFFGDGFQKSKLIGQRRYWRIPVMDGEFLVEEKCSVGKGVAGGNFLIQSVDQSSGLHAARSAIEAINPLPNVITPFPGGVVRSGSKVGSRYRGMVASTADAWCPTLRGRVDSNVAETANCVYEIVVDGFDAEAVGNAMAAGIRAACDQGIVAIAAGNYGGKLGKHYLHLHEILGAS